VTLLTERYANKIRGQLSCYDRILIQGTLPGLCYTQGMTTFLNIKKIRIFDYPRFAEPLRDQLRENAERIAQDNSLQIEFIKKKNFRKEERIQQIIKKRGDHGGLVHIFSAMEPCPTYKPWHDKKSHRTYLKPDSSKCLHYYFYLIDDQLGLCYVRVPTWCPFRLQIYFNGHNWLTTELTKRKIGYELMDNLFVSIDNFNKAQNTADRLNVSVIHKILDRFAERFCPVIKTLKLSYHWSIIQAEYATDIVFNRQQDLKAIYEHLVRTAIHTVKPENVASFLGRKLHGNYQDHVGNNFNTRIEGTRIRHSMGPVAIKMYDKFALALRIESTVNDVSFFKHYRTVEQRGGTVQQKWATMKKGIYSLPALSQLLASANRRYLEFVSTFDDISSGVKLLTKITETVVEKNRPYKGFNLFTADDQKIFESIASGEFNISGFQNKNLKAKLAHKTTAQISNIIKRLRAHGLVKKIGHSYKYYLTKIGRYVITAGLQLKELFLIPKLSQVATV
jgi:hypothetical protein